MDIKSFVVELYIIFLGITLTKAIQTIVESFSYFSCTCFLLIFFLAIDFFFAKIKNIGNKKDKQTGLNMALNLAVVCSFAFMPYFMNSFIHFMVVLLCMRVFDALLILEDSNWRYSSINTQEKRWIIFDVCYFFVETIFICIYCNNNSQIVGNILITIYFLLGVFESVFDFVINSSEYMTIDQN